MHADCGELQLRDTNADANKKVGNPCPQARSPPATGTSFAQPTVRVSVVGRDVSEAC
jgi:hypothetical protein